MAAKMYIVAILAMTVAGATACTVTTTTTYSISSYYPEDSIPLVNFKKCMYELNQAVGNMMYKGQSLFDYFMWYSSNSDMYQSMYNQKMSVFMSCTDYLNLTYQRCMRLLDVYKDSVGYMTILSDDVTVTNILL